METLSLGGVLAAFLGGVLAFFSPCMLPVFPGLLSVLGITERRSSGLMNRASGWFRIALMFVFGLTLAFVVLGVGVGAAAELLTPYLGAVERLLGLGLLLSGCIAIAIETGWIARIPVLRALSRESGMKQRLEKASRGFAAPVRAFAIGAGFGLAWTPCIGPFLEAIMTYAVSTGDMGGTTLLFTAFGVGMGSVFLLVAAGAAQFFAKAGRFARVIAIVSGVVLIALGLMFLLDFTDTVSRLLTQWVPDLGRLLGNIG